MKKLYDAIVKLVGSTANSPDPTVGVLPVAQLRELGEAAGEKAVKLLIEKSGKPLKTVPAALKMNVEFKKLRERVAELKKQATRFRKSFEGLMAAGEEFTLAKLEQFLALPVARALIEKLVLRDRRLFLPFADDADPKLSEIVSKILMLANDDKIKDRTILEQIERGGLE